MAATYTGSRTFDGAMAEISVWHKQEELGGRCDEDESLKRVVDAAVDDGEELERLTRQVSPNIWERVERPVGEHEKARSSFAQQRLRFVDPVFHRE